MDHILESVQFEEFFKALERSMGSSKRMKKAWENPSSKRVISSILAGDALVEKSKKWREENPEAALAQRRVAQAAAKRWQEENPEEVAAIRREAQAASAKYWKEHPEELRDRIAKAHAALAQWREENPEKAALLYKNWSAGARKWKQEHPEEIAAHFDKTKAAVLIGAAQWREENPEKVLANTAKARAASAKWREENPEKVLEIARDSKVVSAQWRKEHPDTVARGRETQRNVYLKTYLDRLCFIKSLTTGTGFRFCELQKLCPQWTRDQLDKFLRKAVKRRDLIKISLSFHDKRYCLPAK